MTYHNSFDELFAADPQARYFFLATQGRIPHRKPRYRPGDYLVFGKESTGLSDTILRHYPGTAIRIPMRPGARSLNLSNAVAIVAYEALGQLDFPGLT